jgi:hypothetical protein
MKNSKKEYKWSLGKSMNFVPSLSPDFDISCGKQMENACWNVFGFGTFLFLVSLKGSGRSSIFQEKQSGKVGFP